MLSTQDPSGQAASLASQLPCLMPWVQRESRWDTYDYVLSHASTPSKSTPPERSPKADFKMVLVLRSEELGRTAYMGVQPTHGTVQDSHSSRS